MNEAGQRETEAAATHSEADDDATLITGSLRAPERFGVLFDRHAPVIYRYIARRLGRDAADDLLAEVFLAAFQRRGRYDATRPDARPWLYGIASRLIGRHRRDEVRFFRAIAR
ncbi:MAG: sigma factor, partial [Actinomycetota bacterium]